MLKVIRQLILVLATTILATGLVGCGRDRQWRGPYTEPIAVVMTSDASARIIAYDTSPEDLFPELSLREITWTNSDLVDSFDFKMSLRLLLNDASEETVLRYVEILSQRNDVYAVSANWSFGMERRNVQI